MGTGVEGEAGHPAQRGDPMSPPYMGSWNGSDLVPAPDKDIGCANGTGRWLMSFR